MDGADDAFVAALDALPGGYSEGTYRGARYGLTIERLNGGRTVKGEARQLGGSDYISFNLFRLKGGRVLLKPCEMPEQKVIDFIGAFCVSPR